ncbi:MAG TPA: hypothetical protein P5572_11765 [Phycisphaerae bacterium]|nr:hypothetical protein [Phycisphaerae bacterium]
MTRRLSLPPDRPVLRFSPYAWAKLCCFCHRGDTEIGGFGISRPDDLLLVEDFVTLRQGATFVSVAFDDDAVADFFEAQVEVGRRPEQFARIWIHTHPADCPQPSTTDEATFQRVFGSCSWALMFILARGGQTYCRLRFNAGPGGAMLIPSEVDFSLPFPASDHDAWQAGYLRDVRASTLRTRWRPLNPWNDRRGLEQPSRASFEPSLSVDQPDIELNDCEVPRCTI